jgi:hypothetical protein
MPSLLNHHPIAVLTACIASKQTERMVPQRRLASDCFTALHHPLCSWPACLDTAPSANQVLVAAAAPSFD